MLVESCRNVGKRSRYYHANMDMDFLEAGKSYNLLKTTYVIFICTYDYVGAGKPIYYFQTFDVKNKLYFDDYRYTIILNTSCNPARVPEKLRPLFAYINDPNRVDDEFIQTIDERVQKFNSRDWRQKQMTLAHLMENAEDRGRKIGLEEGLAQGRTEERDRMKQLNEILLESDRIEDLKRAMKDDEYLESLFKEFGLK